MGDTGLIKKHLCPETVMFQHPFTLDTPLHIAASGELLKFKRFVGLSMLSADANPIYI